MATLASAIEQMLNAGMPAFPPGHPRVNTDRIVRYGPKLRGWYRLYESAARNGKFYVHGAYGLWGMIEKATIETDWSGIDEAERERMQRERAVAEEREREKRLDRAKFAARRARAQWQAANQLGGSDYLKRKQVTSDKGLRFTTDGTVLVPMLRYDLDKPALVGLQKIDGQGKKRFNKGMAKDGAACRLGAVRDGEPILVAEGVATALSIRMATGKRLPVFVAFDCYNLAHVAKTLRAKFPEHVIVFCADDDYKTDGNPGLSKAQSAAAAIGNAKVIAPQFKDRIDQAWTDFNDLHCVESLQQVEQQLADVYKPPEKKKKTTTVPPGTINWQDLFARYTLIYPTETAWDAHIGEIVKLSAMRVALKKGPYDYWLNSDDRRMVNATDVVFDPSGECDLATKINLFRGWDTTPSSEGSCAKILEMLQWLCGEEGVTDPIVTQWVLRWCAYPLRHRGAKMRTAVVMHGTEGTGKNMFWEVVKDIYGPYGAFITQFQLQSQFNDWASRKMFVIANEVVTRMELKHLVGYLKNLVTESRIPIETKNMPVREEDNHMQLVFLSNELRPLHISPGDRRYAVIRTPGPRPAAYYAEVAEEIANGGMSRFYQYLLDEIDIGDFNEHTKPPITEAKTDLIELGLSSTQLFWHELYEGIISLPYGPCLSNDLYRAYQVWCARNGEKLPARVNVFSHEFMNMNGVTRLKLRVANPSRPAEEKKQRKVFLMGERPIEARTDEKAKQIWIEGGIADFRQALRDFISGGSGGSSDADGGDSK